MFLFAVPKKCPFTLSMGFHIYIYVDLSLPWIIAGHQEKKHNEVVGMQENSSNVLHHMKDNDIENIRNKIKLGV